MRVLAPKLKFPSHYHTRGLVWSLTTFATLISFLWEPGSILNSGINAMSVPVLSIRLHFRECIKSGLEDNLGKVYADI